MARTSEWGANEISKSEYEAYGTSEVIFIFKMKEMKEMI
jgi:hypothetical protein